MSREPGIQTGNVFGTINEFMFIYLIRSRSELNNLVFYTLIIFIKHIP